MKQSCAKDFREEDVDYEVIEDRSRWKSLILLIPLRLGGEQMNPTYDSCLKGLLSLEQCIGIIGGKPKHSQYFIGWQEDYLIHLDPHHCQEMVDVLAPNFPLKSFHCRELRKTALKHVDPSCCVGFYLRTQRDFDEFRRNVQHYLVPPSSSSSQQGVGGGGGYPIFAFSSGSSPHLDDAWFSDRPSSTLPSSSNVTDGGGVRLGDSSSSSHHLDDFEFL